MSLDRGEHNIIPSDNLNELSLPKSFDNDDLRSLIEEKNIEKESLKEQFISEIKEDLNKELIINESRVFLYGKLWVDFELSKNSAFENFVKWVVDELVIWNYELVIEIYNTWWEIIIESLKALASWEGIKSIAEALWENIMDLFSGDAYDKGKSFAALGLITTWLLAWVAVWKKGLKYWMKSALKLKHLPTESINSPIVKNAVSDVQLNINKIIPNKTFDFEASTVESISKLDDVSRLDAANFYLKKELWMPEQEAILKAHNVWMDRSWSWVFNYTFAEIREKRNILSEHFSQEEVRTLLEKWVAWRPVKWEEMTTWAVMELKWMNYLDVNRLLKAEIDLLKNAESNLVSFFDNLSKKDTVDVSNKWNFYLQSKLWDASNFLDYIIDFTTDWIKEWLQDGAKASVKTTLRDRVVKNYLSELLWQVKHANGLGFVIDQGSKDLYFNIKRKVDLLMK